MKASDTKIVLSASFQAAVRTLATNSLACLSSLKGAYALFLDETLPSYKALIAKNIEVLDKADQAFKRREDNIMPVFAVRINTSEFDDRLWESLPGFDTLLEEFSYNLSTFWDLYPPSLQDPSDPVFQSKNEVIKQHVDWTNDLSSFLDLNDLVEKGMEELSALNPIENNIINMAYIKKLRKVQADLKTTLSKIDRLIENGNDVHALLNEAMHCINPYRTEHLEGILARKVQKADSGFSLKK